MERRLLTFQNAKHPFWNYSADVGANVMLLFLFAFAQRKKLRKVPLEFCVASLDTTIRTTLTASRRGVKVC